MVVAAGPIAGWQVVSSAVSRQRHNESLGHASEWRPDAAAHGFWAALGQDHPADFLVAGRQVHLRRLG